MCVSPSQIRTPTPLKARARTFFARNFTPSFVTDWKTRKAKLDSYSPAPHDISTRRKKLAIINVACVALLRTGAAFAIYQLTAATYGVSARDTQLTFSAEKAWANASAFSLTVANCLRGLIPPDMKEMAATIVIPAEITLSLARMYVEQKVWHKMKITPDPAGTLLTPYLAGAMELVYKAAVTYPQDADSRLMVGLVGIYGNIVRMANAGILYLAWRIEI